MEVVGLMIRCLLVAAYQQLRRSDVQSPLANPPFLYPINPMLYPHGCDPGFAGRLTVTRRTESG